MEKEWYTALTQASNIVKYKASDTCRDFHKSDAFVRLLLGPIGSGKSVASCIELFTLAQLQEPDRNNVRRTRWAIIRNTYRELIDTTCKTWWDWFPKEMGLWRQMDMTHRIINELPDGTTVDMEVMFRALDKPGDIKKLLSLELTGGWINECREVPKAILDALIGRCGRFPPIKDGTPATWIGVILDTNPPDSDHWIYRVFEEGEDSMPPEVLEDLSPEILEQLKTANTKWDIFHQPSGLSVKAENIKNLPPNYYLNMLQGKDPEWIKVYVHGEYGFVSDGLPVVPEFKDSIHVTNYNIDFAGDILYIGIDFGRTPAATFAQEINGQVQVIDELVTFGTSATHFAKLLAERIKGHYPRDIEIIATGDPAGENPGEQIDDTCIDIINNAGIPCDGAHTNNFTIRREAVSIPLGQLTMHGTPQLIISPNCRVLRKGMNGGYRYKRMQVSGEYFQNKPDKNKYSHVCESLQYLLLGMGKGYEVISSHSDVSKFKVKGALQ